MRLTYTLGTLLAGLLLGAGIPMAPRLWTHIHLAISGARQGSSTGAGQPIHTERTFAFTINAPAETVAPLFGANKERAWAPGWNPAFVWPDKAADQAGMVFTVAHGDKTAVWVNTSFELSEGLCQYVYVIPDAMVTVISLRWSSQGKSTHVTVKYDRTALNTAANGIVQQMADQDAVSGPEWERQIHQYLTRASR